MRRLLVVRHPMPVIAQGTCYGQLNIPAHTDHLQQVVQRLTPALLPFNICHVVSSDLIRCQQLAERLPFTFSASSLWRERHFGSWEGQSWAQINKAQIDLWVADPFFFAPPGGETLWQMLNRMLTGLAQLPDHSLLIAHAGVVRCLDLLLTGKNVYADQSLGYGMYKQFEWNPAWWPHRYGAEGALLQQLVTAHWRHGNTIGNRSRRTS